MYRGRHVATMRPVRRLMSSVLDPLKAIIKDGVAKGVIRAGLDPFDVYLMITSLSFYNVSNRYTVAAIWNYDLSSRISIKERRKSVVDVILRYVAA